MPEEVPLPEEETLREGGLPPEVWGRISGHSARVGAAQDLLALDIDMSVMQAGRWKDTRMPMRYGEKVLAQRHGLCGRQRNRGVDRNRRNRDAVAIVLS